MKEYDHMKFSFKVCCCLCAIYMLSSCIRDLNTDCHPDVYLQFSYTYNMQESNAFAHEVERVSVWVFDSDGIFISRHIEEKNITDNYRLNVGNLPPGDYTFVAWCRSTKYNEESSNYNYTEMIPGISTIEDLTARLSRTDENYYKTKMNNSLNGTTSANIGNGSQTVTMDMIKCTNTLRIILMPYRADQQLDADDFALAINGKNAWLCYDASIYMEDQVIYRPYYKETLCDENAKLGTRADGTPINNAVVAEMNMSRLFYELEPRFTIRDTRNDNTLMDINLTWLLSLQSIGDHRTEWSDQEYLDRQDRYSITFFIDGDVLMHNRIIVNGWNISLDSSELQ